MSIEYVASHLRTRSWENPSTHQSSLRRSLGILWQSDGAQFDDALWVNQVQWTYIPCNPWCICSTMQVFTTSPREIPYFWVLKLVKVFNYCLYDVCRPHCFKVKYPSETQHVNSGLQIHPIGTTLVVGGNVIKLGLIQVEGTHDDMQVHSIQYPFSGREVHPDLKAKAESGWLDPNTQVRVFFSPTPTLTYILTNIYGASLYRAKKKFHLTLIDVPTFQIVPKSTSSSSSPPLRVEHPNWVDSCPRGIEESSSVVGGCLEESAGYWEGLPFM